MSLQELILPLLKATEAAAFASKKWAGRGESKAADQAAVDAMRGVLNSIPFKGVIAIGEGERDKAPMLYMGEKLGTQNGKEIDLAVDPLEGTDICAAFADGAMSVLVAAPKDTILYAPDVYMEKIAVGRNIPSNLVSLDVDIKLNLERLAEFKNCKITDLKVAVLQRPRHLDLINSIRECGSQLKLLNDCDISPILTLLLFPEELDMYVGIGGAPEGVLAASAVKSLGGHFEGKLLFRDKHEESKAKKCSITNLNKIYTQDDLIKEQSIFLATGVTNSRLLQGITHKESLCNFSSLIITDNNFSFIQQSYIQTIN